MLSGSNSSLKIENGMDFKQKTTKSYIKSTFISFKYLDEDVANVCFSLSVS